MSRCNCLDQIGKLAREKFGAGTHLDLELLYPRAGGPSRCVPPVLRIRVPVLTKQGKHKGYQKIPVFPSFCQFCGKPLKPASEPTADAAREKEGS